MDTLTLGYVRTLVFAALLGLPVAFAAVLFQTVLHDATHVVWDVVPDRLDWSEPAWWYVVLVPGLAGVLVAAALRLPGHGGHSPLEGLGVGTVRAFELPSILLAGLATLSLGLVLGPEAPLIALGAGLGASAVRLLPLETSGAQLLTLAGAFAALAVLFGNPLVTGLLLYEVAAAGGSIPSAVLGRALLPGFVAAGTASLVFTGVGDWPGFHQVSLSLPALPAYESTRVSDLAWCLLLSVVVAFVVVGLRHGAHAVATRGSARPDAMLVAAGLAVGAIAVGFRALADRPVDLVLFSGQVELPAVIAEGSAGVLALLVVAKGLAYALSLGAGFRGGPIFPALAIGVMLGVLGADLLPGLELTPAVAAGIAAGTAAVARWPFTAVLLATLLLGPSAVDVAPIAILAAAAAWVVATALPNPEDRVADSRQGSPANP